MTYKRIHFSDPEQLQERAKRCCAYLVLEARFERLADLSEQWGVNVYEEVKDLAEVVLSGLLESKLSYKIDGEKYKEYSIHARDLLRLVDGLKKDRLIEITPRSELAICLDQLDRKSSKRPDQTYFDPVAV